MKLKPHFEDNYGELYRSGYLFDPDAQAFFSCSPDDFIYPAGFENWTVELIDKDSYLNERIKGLGIELKECDIELIGGPGLGQDERVIQPIFTANKRGDIEISQYTLERRPHTYFQQGEKHTTSPNREKYHIHVRLAPWHERIAAGKYDFTRALNTPFWPPLLVDAYETGEEVETLIITEGQIKAFKAAYEGLMCCGLTSITHFQTGSVLKELHREILLFIYRCKVKKVVVLWDGDALNINSKHLEAGTELTQRPNQFKSAALAIRDGIEKTNPKIDCYFAMIKDEKAKGIDDLFVERKGQEETILKDFDTIGVIPGQYIAWVNIKGKSGEAALNNFFHLNSVNSFYTFHSKRIDNREFIYQGTTFEIKEGAPSVKIDKNLKFYKLIGTNFFKHVKQPIVDRRGNEIGKELVLKPWKSEIITLKHGKDALTKIEWYQGFCNIASHTNFQPIIGNHYNLYQNTEHVIEPGIHPNISSLLKHLFEEHYDNDMIYDYFSILYTMPYEKLPIICLFSEEEGTGKSTFVNLLKEIFKSNMALISSEDFMGNWNSHWITKLIVASEETFFEKPQALDKLKNYSLAEKIMVSERFVASAEVSCLMKFVFLSNHRNFLRLTKKSTRFWVREIKSIRGKDDPDFMDKVRAELPAFLHFISTREITNPKVYRMWFSPDQYRTAALESVINEAEPTIVKDLRDHLSEMFEVTGLTELFMTVGDLREAFKIPERYGNAYLRKVVLREHLQVDLAKDHPFAYTFNNKDGEGKYYPQTRNGRPFRFPREKFVIDSQQKMNFKDAD